jgi:hypothetical protein
MYDRITSIVFGILAYLKSGIFSKSGKMRMTNAVRIFILNICLARLLLTRANYQVFLTLICSLTMEQHVVDYE